MRVWMMIGTFSCLVCLVSTPAWAVDPGPPKPAAVPIVAPDTGPFTMEQATAGLKGKGGLVATLEIVQKNKPLATLHCELFADKAPLSVANFVGLARGVRAFKEPKGGQWVKRPLYDGMTIHRVVPEYIIQAGDPQCQNDPNCGNRAGYGDPGYAFPDELENGLRPTQGGVLAMANRGPNTNGSQFFITEREALFLLGQQTIFGQCAEVAEIKKITAVPRGPRDMPNDAVIIKKVTISHKAR